MQAWILKLMLSLAVVSTPWEDTYAATAQAIADVAEASPLYAGEDGRVRTAAELVAIAWFESRFDPHAVKADRGGDSLGLGQVNVSNLATLGTTRAELLTERGNLRAMVTLLRASHVVCHARRFEEQVAQYASGGGGCSNAGGLEASRHRLRLARALLAASPPFWREPVDPLWKLHMDKYLACF